MARRQNGAGTLEKRGRVWYTKVYVNGKKVMRTTGTGDRAKALAILDDQTMGSDLPAKERLAAIMEHLRDEAPRPDFTQAWTKYVDAPENAGQSDSGSSAST